MRDVNYLGFPKVRGERIGISKMTDETVREARRLRSDGWKVAELAKRYGVSRSTMSDALRGRTWSHVA